MRNSYQLSAFSCQRRKVPSCKRTADSGKLKAGFTLVEVLLTSAILAMIGTAILAVFGSGLRVYERIQAFGSSQADVLLSIEHLQKDLRNTFMLSTIGFTGSGSLVAFPAVLTRLDESDEETEELGQVIYRQDQGYLIRETKGYAQAVGGRGGTAASTSERLAPVKEVAFFFYQYDAKKESYAWQTSWDKEAADLPRAVKMEATYLDGAEEKVVSRTIMIAAQAVPEEEDEESEEEI